MYRIMYLSNATVDFTDEDLEKLLEKSRINNSKKSITGLLIKKGRSFLQCLEGSRDDVLELFEKIKGDERHNNIIELIEDDEQGRYFPNWSMGYKTINHLDEVKSQKLLDFSKHENIELTSKGDIADIFKEFIEVK